MTNPLEYFLHWESNSPGDIFLRQANAHDWNTWTFAEAGLQIRKIAAYLVSLQLPKGSHIALLSKNCPHWIMADLAIMMAGHVSIPLYPTLPPETIRQILDHSESFVIFIGKLDNYAAQRPGIPGHIKKIAVEMFGEREENTWEKLCDTYAPLPEIPRLNPEDMMTIVYTSGTTGTPKGVMHVYKSFHATISAALKVVPFPQRPRLFSYLPMSHIAERIGIEIMGLRLGAQFSFSENLETFPRNLADTQPDYFFAVPRIWSKFQEKILEKIPERKLSTLVGLPLVGSIVKHSIRRKLGLAKAKLCISGAAPMSVAQLQWWNRLGVMIYEAYGMTEDCVYAHFNTPSSWKFGTVGKPLPELKVKITDEEEICVKSDYLMRGYYKEPELTAQMYDADGYLKTGDTGELDKEGFLKIVGRVKDQFKTDKGKYISPAPIEMKILENKDIGQVAVVGMGIPQPIMLVVLTESARKKSKEEIIRSLTDTIDKVNLHLETYERLETAVVMQHDWTQENGLLTPTLKLKRNQLEKIHVPRYPKWYHEQGRVVWE